MKVVNPHVTIQFRGDDGERYTVIWQAPQAPQALARRGFYVEGQGGLKDLLTPGDRLRSLELQEFIMPPEKYAGFIEAELGYWRKFLQRTGIRLDP